MEQKLELLEKEQKIRQEVESLHEIINILQTEMHEKNFNCDDYDNESDTESENEFENDYIHHDMMKIKFLLIKKSQKSVEDFDDKFQKLLSSYKKKYNKMIMEKYKRIY